MLHFFWELKLGSVAPKEKLIPKSEGQRQKVIHILYKIRKKKKMTN